MIFYVANKLFCIDDHDIEVPSELEQEKEPAEVDTLPSQLQSPPNFGIRPKLIQISFQIR